MEEFDRQIRSKIDSLGEVPGVEFDEKGVWKKIKHGLSGGLVLFIGLIALFTLLTTIFLSKYNSQTEMVDYDRATENKSKDLMAPNVFRADSSQAIEEFKSQDVIDSRIIYIKDELPVSKIEKKRADSIKYFSLESKNSVVQTASIHQLKKVPDKKQSAPIIEYLDGQTNEEIKEVSLSAGKNNLTIGVTRLKKMTPHFSLTYGLHINRNFDARFKANEAGFTPSNTNQVQVLLGIRYNLYNAERRFKSHLSAGFKNSFSSSFETKNINYNLSFESNLNFDYRIFSTKNGKKGYLRFSLPLYNSDIINQGVYRPSLYDVLER